MNEAPEITLFNTEIDKENISILLEQYRLYVESANLTSKLRSQTNNFFLTINTTLVSLICVIPQVIKTELILSWILFICIAGVLLAISWYYLIRSYRALNSGRFEVIHELESKLPARIYQREWEIVTARRPKKAFYVRQTNIEQIVPVAFGLVYVTIMILQTL